MIDNVYVVLKGDEAVFVSTDEDKAMAMAKQMKMRYTNDAVKALEEKLNTLKSDLKIIEMAEKALVSIKNRTKEQNRSLNKMQEIKGQTKRDIRDLEYKSTEGAVDSWLWDNNQMICVQEFVKRSGYDWDDD